MMSIATRAFRDVDAPAYLLAATGTPFQGRAVSSDRRGAPAKGRTVPAGLGTPVGVGLDDTTTPRGIPMS